MTQADGSTFYNPYEGLKTAKNLMGIIRLNDLERRLASAVPMVRKIFNNAVNSRGGEIGEPLPYDVIQAIRATEAVLWDVRKRIQTGELTMKDPAIDYPTVTVNFTAISFCDFAIRSIKEILHANESGRFLLDPRFTPPTARCQAGKNDSSRPGWSFHP